MYSRSASTWSRMPRSDERGAERLDVVDRRAQPAVLVEVAAHELDRRVVVRVQDAGAGVVRLAPRRVRGQRAAEGLVLAVAHVVEADLLPARAPVGGVHVRQEGRVARAEDARLVAEDGEELGQLARDHRARVGAGEVRAEDDADVLGQGERLAHGGQPAGDRGGVLREEGDHVAARALGGEVARPAVAELARLDLDHRGARLARDLLRAVARARVDDEDLVRALAGQRVEQLGEKARPVSDGDHRGDALGHRVRRPRIRPAVRNACLAITNAHWPVRVAITRFGSIFQRSSQ